MKKEILAIAAAATLALTLSGCGSSGSSSSTSGDKSVVTDSTKAADVGTFGTPLVAADGSAYTLSPLSSFTPKSSLGETDSANQKFETFSITVKNGSKAALDLSGLIVASSTPTGECSDILDGDSNLAGAPFDPIAVGATSTFKWALSCPGAAGDQVDIAVQVGGVNVIAVTGKLV